MTKLLFTSEDYTIEKTKHCYRINVLCAKRFANCKMERDWYSYLENKIEGAHEVAKYAIEEFFVAGKKPVPTKYGFKIKK